MSWLNPHGATHQPYHLSDGSSEIIQLARDISPYLHNSIKSPHCNYLYPNLPCGMCINAARLAAVQVVPKVAREILENINSSFGNHCTVTHPGDDW